MRVDQFTTPLRPALRAIAIGWLFALLLAAGVPGRTADAGLQYDEVTKFVGQNDQPQPGNFAADYQAAVSAAQQQAAATNNMTQHHGLFSMIKNTIQAAKTVGASIKFGFPSTEYYLGRLHRSDDPGTQTATIYRPDRNQIIRLNLANKTYSITDTSMQRMTEGPPPGASQQRPQGPQPTPQPGSGKLDVSVSHSALGPKTIENVPTVGYAMSFKGTMSNSTGSCRDGSLQTSMTEYVSEYADPSVTVAPAAQPAFKSEAHPELAGVAWGCKPKVTYHKSGSGQAPSGRLSMWTLIAIGGSAATTQGAVGGRFQTLIERGNVKTLGGGDRNLFEIPAGFTKESPSPTPAP